MPRLSRRRFQAGAAGVRFRIGQRLGRGQIRHAGRIRRALAARTKRREVTPRKTAWFMLRDFGWRTSQFRYLDRLWDRESGWNVYATNT